MTGLMITQSDGSLVVSSEAVADGAGVQHKNVLELISNNLPDFEEFGHVAFATRDGYNNHKVRVALLNEQQATLLMTYQRNTDRVRQFKKALVKAFFEMAQKSRAPSVPQSLPDALRAYALEVEQRQALEARVAADAPKVHFADAVATSDSTILVGELAKILKGNGADVGANRLFALLRDEGYLIRRQGSDWNMPTQRSMELGLFQIKESTHQQPDGTVRITKTPKVTGKGQQYFVSRYALRAVA